MPGGRTSRQGHRHAPAILRRDVVMVDYPHGSQLCRMDIVELYDSGTRMPRGSISLGSFVPYVKVKPGQGTRTP